MPVRVLKECINNPNYPLRILKDMKIAIDGFWFLRMKFNTISKNDLLNIEKYLERELKDLFDFIEESYNSTINLKNRMEIIWVWDGIKYKDTNALGTDLEMSEKISNLLEVDRLRPYHLPLEFMVEPVNKILLLFNKRITNREKQAVDNSKAAVSSDLISIIRAPYSAMAQCAYFLNNEVVNYIFTKSDVLLFANVKSVIVEISFKTQMYFLLETEVCLKTFNISSLEYFRHFCLASGSELCPTVPSLAEVMTSKSLLDLMETKADAKSNKSLSSKFSTQCPNCSNGPCTNCNGNTLFEEELNNNLEYKKLYEDALFNIKYHPVILINTGRVECFPDAYTYVDANTKVNASMSSNEIPRDLELIFGKKLPNTFYEMLFKCEISPMALELIVFKPPKNTILRDLKNKLEMVLKLRDEYYDTAGLPSILKKIFGLGYTHISEFDWLKEMCVLHFASKIKHGPVTTGNPDDSPNTDENAIEIISRFLNQNTPTHSADAVISSESFYYSFKLFDYGEIIRTFILVLNKNLKIDFKTFYLYPQFFSLNKKINPKSLKLLLDENEKSFPCLGRIKQ